MNPRPPHLLERFLDRAVASSPYREEIVGDLHEAYAAVHARRSAAYARGWYALHALRLAARYLLRTPAVFPKRGHSMDRLAMDLRLATRSLIKRPLMTATVVMTLALGIGANAAIFGIIDALVIRPFTMRDVDRIVMPVQTVPNEIGKRESVTPANFLDWRRDLEGKSIQDLAAFEWWEANLMGRDEPEHALGFHVSSRFFDVMGVRPALGRPFLREEEILGRDRKVMLSDGLWRRRFGQDPSIVGQAVLVDGAQSEVVGVMPPGFDFPMGAEIWAPLAFDPKTPPSRTGTSLTVVGRLAPGRTVADAQAEMAVIAARLQRDFPRENRDRGVRVYTVAAGMRDVGLDAILSLWQAAALFVLLIACANIANLLLARGAERAREMAVRLALGSSRGRIIRESMLESLLLAMAAVPLALAAAWTFLTVIRSFMPARLIRFVAGWNEMAVDGRNDRGDAGARRRRGPGVRGAAGAADVPRPGRRRAEVGRPHRQRPRPPASSPRAGRRGNRAGDAAARRRTIERPQRDALSCRLAGLRSERRPDVQAGASRGALRGYREPPAVCRRVDRRAERRARCLRRGAGQRPAGGRLEHVAPCRDRRSADSRGDAGAGGRLPDCHRRLLRGDADAAPLGAHLHRRRSSGHGAGRRRQPVDGAQVLARGATRSAASCGSAANRGRPSSASAAT
jgi:hypothetical protein